MAAAMRLIILAAGQGTRLRPLTDDRPKCLVELNGRPLLDWHIDAARAAGIDDVVVIGGYRADQLPRPGVRVLVNPEYETTNMVHTLFCGEGEFGDGFVLGYGDIAYSPAVMSALLAHRSSIGVVVDRDWRSYWSLRFDNPLADAESLRMEPDGRITSIGQREASIDDIAAQYIGLVAFRGAGVAALRAAWADAVRDDAEGRHPFGGPRPLRALYMTDLLQGLVDRGVRLDGVPIHGGWLEIDSRTDLAVGERLADQGRLST
jgi:L-glutamine-phosphate cytidylyltransferase